MLLRARVEARRWRRRTTIRRLLGFVVRKGVILAVLTAGSFAAGTAAFALVDEFTAADEVNARTWASLQLRYADPATCRGCHAAAVARATTSEHRGVSCESCHGPLGDHSIAKPIRAMPVPRPAGETCGSCHEVVTGMPIDVSQLEREGHYGASACLECHDAHSAIAPVPPPTLHRLERLPECVVCHKVEGLTAAPQGHLSEDDDVCLACHAHQAVDSRRPDVR